MTTYSAQDRLTAAQKAGFPDPLTAVAVSLAEFGENRDINVQSQSDIVSGGVREPSFGPWQIHLPSHPDVTQSCAMDLTCSTKKAFIISEGGTNFAPWTAFTSGAYKTELAQFLDPIKALATPTSPTPAQGDTGPAGPSGGAAGAAPSASCGLDMLSILEAGNRLQAGQSTSQIAADFTKELGRPITPECLQGDAYKVATDIGNFKVPGEDAVKGLGAGLSGLTGIAAAIKNVQDSFRAENLWRAAFIIVGAGAVFIGGRMYLADSDAPRVPEAVSG